MNKKSDSYIKKHLKRAAEALTPDDASKIWEQPAGKASGDEWYLDGTRPKKRSFGKIIGLTASVAACLAVCLLSFYTVNLRVDATVYLDENPSVALRINGRDRVVRAEASNDDGKVILEDMDLKNTDLDVAVNAILGSMVKHGYLSEAKDIILLSVDSGSPEKSEALRAELSEEMDACLTSLIGSGSIFDQEVTVDDSLKALAEEYGITPGKAGLLQKVVDAHPELDYSLLAGMSMTDLVRYLADAGIDLRDFANYTGTSYDDIPDAGDVKPAEPDTGRQQKKTHSENVSDPDDDDADDNDADDADDDDPKYEKPDTHDDDERDDRSSGKDEHDDDADDDTDDVDDDADDDVDDDADDD